VADLLPPPPPRRKPTWGDPDYEPGGFVKFLLLMVVALVWSLICYLVLGPT